MSNFDCPDDMMLAAHGIRELQMQILVQESYDNTVIACAHAMDTQRRRYEIKNATLLKPRQRRSLNTTRNSTTTNPHMNLIRAPDMIINMPQPWATTETDMR